MTASAHAFEIEAIRTKRRFFGRQSGWPAGIVPDLGTLDHVSPPDAISTPRPAQAQWRSCRHPHARRHGPNRWFCQVFWQPPFGHPCLCPCGALGLVCHVTTSVPHGPPLVLQPETGSGGLGSTTARCRGGGCHLARGERDISTLRRRQAHREVNSRRCTRQMSASAGRASARTKRGEKCYLYLRYKP